MLDNNGFSSISLLNLIFYQMLTTFNILITTWLIKVGSHHIQFIYMFLQHISGSYNMMITVKNKARQFYDLKNYIKFIFSLQLSIIFVFISYLFKFNINIIRINIVNILQIFPLQSHPFQVNLRTTTRPKHYIFIIIPIW